jgi:nanoRNase/pAp phosphatase (c-di-AMP/oligoRNAs hydrolase)
MTAFVDSIVQTTSGSALAVARRARHRPRARRLLRLLSTRRNILITTHEHPDPDALASSLALARLLRSRLPQAKVTLSVKSFSASGLNAAFAQQTEQETTPWNDHALASFDAIVLLDVQPTFRYSPLPADIAPTAVIDHHRARGRRPACEFADIHSDVGATCSIVFSYFLELDEPIDPDLAATMLFAIETDLAGAAGQPGDLDTVALSSLTLRADTRKLYKMRYVDLPRTYYVAYASALANAWYWDHAMISDLDELVSPEMPAVMADFLLRFDQVEWVLVTALSAHALVLSLRTSDSRLSAGDVMRRLVRGLGEGGGHRTKAGGLIPLTNGTDAEIERLRKVVRRRLLRRLKIRMSRGQRLVPREPR